MNITDVKIRRINEIGKMKAIASITFENEFAVHDIKIIEGRNGLFIAMPSRRMSEGDFKDIAHPLNSEMRNKIKDAIFKEYEIALAERADAEEAAPQESADMEIQNDIPEQEPTEEESMPRSESETTESE